MNSLLIGQFELVSLFVYGVQYLKKTEELGFQLVILLNFEVFATQPDFIAQDVALQVDIFIVNLVLEHLGIVKVLLTNSHQFSELEE